MFRGFDDGWHEYLMSSLSWCWRSHVFLGFEMSCCRTKKFNVWSVMVSRWKYKMPWCQKTSHTIIVIYLKKQRLINHLPSSLRERSSILIFCKASSSSAHLDRSFSRASFMSQYCMGTAGWGCGARAPLVVVPTSSRRRPNIPWRNQWKCWL